MFAVEMINITKTFAEKVIANNSIDLSVKKGEVHAIVGENGAGKSTLMNILYGMYQPDNGLIKINGKEEVIYSPAKAIQLRIGMVHQHFMLVPPLTVLENIILGSEPVDKFLLDFKKAKERISQIAGLFKIEADLDAKIEDLPVGIQQRVEILKLLYRDAEILILDEPTAVLTPLEINELFNTIDFLKSKGKTIILITHKLKEVKAISDTITVLRHGAVKSTTETKDTSIETIARLMVGEDKIYDEKKIEIKDKKLILEVKNVTVINDQAIEVVKNISFEVHSNEIFGIAGVEGNGQLELIEAISFIRKHSNGSIKLNHLEIDNKQNIGHIPSDRHRNGIVMDFSLAENLILGRENETSFKNGIVIDEKKVDSFARKLVNEYDVRPNNINAKIKFFSGGNQQKAVVAREISKNSELIIASHPTRGLDIKAASFVHNALIKERDNGKAVILVSSDLSELLKLSDRIAVIYNGQINVIFNADNTNEYELGMYMTGGRQ